MGGGGGGASLKLKKAAKKIFVQTCGSFCQAQQPHLHNSTATTVTLSLPHTLLELQINMHFLYIEETTMYAVITYLW